MDNRKNKKRYIIVGSGPAGIAAVDAIRSRDKFGEIVVVGDEPDGYYSRPGLAYLLTGEIPEEMLFPFRKEDFSRLNLTWICQKATFLKTDEQTLVLESGQRLEYDRLLLATGARARATDLPGIEAEGVVKLDNLTDARHILKLARRARNAVVVGGGITALELVEGFVARKVKTHYLLRGDRYWSNVLDETESAIVERRLKEHGVLIHTQTEVKDILSKRGRLTGVRTTQGETLACDLLAVAIGIQPRKGLAESAGIKCDRGVLVDEYLRTSARGVFAAGDVAQVYDRFSGKSVLDSLWNPARQQGHTAGLNMTLDEAGETAFQPYDKSVPFNVTRLAGLTTTIIGTVGQGADRDVFGIVRGDSETWRSLPDAIAAQSNFDVNRLRLLVGESRLLGAIVMGDQTLSQPLCRMIAQRTDISSIRAALLSPQAPLSDILADFWIQVCKEIPNDTH